MVASCVTHFGHQESWYKKPCFFGLSLLGTDRWRLPWNRIWAYRIWIFGNIGNETWRNTETPRFNIRFFLVLIHCRSPVFLPKNHIEKTGPVNSPSASGLQWINRPVSAQSNSWLIGSLRAIWVIYGDINIYISDLSLSTTMTCWPKTLSITRRDPKTLSTKGPPFVRRGFTSNTKKKHSEFCGKHWPLIIYYPHNLLINIIYLNFLVAKQSYMVFRYMKLIYGLDGI